PGATKSIRPFRNIELRVGRTIVFCRLSIYRSVTGSKKHLKPLKTREPGKAKIERRLTASWRLRFSWNFAGRRPWVTDHERRWSVPWVTDCLILAPQVPMCIVSRLHSPRQCPISETADAGETHSSVDRLA